MTVKSDVEVLKTQIETIKMSAGFGFLVVVVTSLLLFYLKTDNSSDYYLKFLDPLTTFAAIIQIL